MKSNNQLPHNANLRKSLIRLLSTAGPVLALSVPGAAYAQNAVNTARITAPVGTFEINTANNESIDTDTILAVMVAANDTVNNVNGLTGATAVVNAFTGDTVNGVAASAANSTLSVLPGAVPAGLTFNTATGAVDVAAGTPAGTYTFTYKICETANPTNCKTATITVNVVAAPIVADPDSITGVNGATGAPDALNVLDGDTLNGAPATLAKVDVSVVTPATPASAGAPVPTLNVATGLISVPAGTPAGTYNITYKVCEKLNPTNCSTNTASVTVAPSSIAAGNDTVTGVNGLTGATAVVNAFTSDLINGVAASPTNAILSVAPGAVPAGLAFNAATGAVDVAPNTPAGTYSFVYTICEKLNPTNCKTATISVTVVAAALVADPDPVTGVNGATGAPNVVNVLDGDTLNGVPVTPSNVTLSVLTPAVPASPGAPVPTLDVATGQVSVPAGTPAGTYPITYQICEKLNPTNCVSATTTITVEPSAIVATNDTVTGVNGLTGATAVANAFTGDKINGVAASAANSILSVAPGAVPAGLTFDTTTGAVDVAPGTPAGTYTFVYTICEKLNPTNCKTATISVTVVAAAISADPDSVAGVNGVSGAPNVVDVLAGDLLNGVQVTPSQVDISVTTPAVPVSPGAPVPTLNLATGTVSVPAGTPAGTYPITYKICEKLNPSNCSTNTVTVTVAASVDLQVTKSNGTTSVFSGSTTTYTLTVKNNGPDSAIGAVISDTPGAGLTCPAANPVTFAGAGSPSGSFTVANLTGTGITLGTIANGQTVTVTYSCQVN